MSDRMLIVGAGEAGARAALTLREQGWHGAIDLVGEEAQLPYERPPLSKASLATVEAPLPAHILDQARCDEAKITLHRGVRALALNPAEHTLSLDDGRQLSYTRLLLATGARARRLRNPDGEAPELLYLRRFEDAMALRRWLRPDVHLAIIGGGFIGLEIAAAARARGCQVSLIEQGERLLMRAVPASLAQIMAQRHRQAGVELILGTALRRIERSDKGWSIELADAPALRVDCVLVGIGAEPDTALASTAGLHLDNGIAVDGQLRSSDPDIFAAGDCCSFPHPLYEHSRLRLEAWRNAQDQAALAAANMLGGAADYAAVPWFWSDHYESTLQIAGLPGLASHTVTRVGDDGVALHFHLADDGRLLGASAFGPNAAIARDIRLAELLIARRARPDPAQLATPQLRLKSLLAA